MALASGHSRSEVKRCHRTGRRSSGRHLLLGSIYTANSRQVRCVCGVYYSGGYRGGGQGDHAPLLEAHVPTLPLQKSVESKAGKRDFKNRLPNL